MLRPRRSPVLRTSGSKSTAPERRAWPSADSPNIDEKCMQAPPFSALRSSIPGIAWPAIPAQTASQLAAVLFQLDKSQWWSPTALEELQFRQLAPLLKHAYDTVPFYRQRLEAVGCEPGQAVEPSLWRALPLLSRSDIQSADQGLVSTHVPKEHGEVSSSTTSGSTGQPLRVHSTKLNRFMWMAFAMREHQWHGRDFNAKLAAIRYVSRGSSSGAPPDGTLAADWGSPVSILHRTGPAALLDINCDISVQAAWLMHHEPQYLLTYPSNLESLARYCLAEGIRIPGLREIRSISEILYPSLRELCRDAFGAEIIDVYSCNEVGYVAVQCPDCHQYHVQSENLICEVLDEAGQPCAPGETGRRGGHAPA